LKILLTGSSGFTGQHFLVAAQNAGHHVISFHADLADKPAVVEEVAAAQPDAVVHLAAISFVGHSDEAAFYAVNVVGTANLLSALAALPKPPHKVLLASSSAWRNTSTGARESLWHE
jgi:nucleoside-diphosphate-sugar epimerase